VIDYTMLDELERRLGGAATAVLIEHLVDIFLRDTPERIAAIESAVQAGDAGALVEAAHALRGSSTLLGGAGRIAQLCAALEEIAATHSVEGAAQPAGDLQEAFEHTSEALVRQVSDRARVSAD
jgi:HPt (histidine-containing phosphotransfer) domain-containing protein